MNLVKTKENKLLHNGFFVWTNDEKELLIDEYGKFYQTTSQNNN